jgi:hypothetical protein
MQDLQSALYSNPTEGLLTMYFVNNEGSAGFSDKVLQTSCEAVGLLVRSLRLEFRVAAWSYRGDPACDRAQVADPLDPRRCLAVNKHVDKNTELFVVACCLL